MSFNTTIAFALASLAGLANSANAQFSLTLLHNGDAESQLINAGSGLEDFGGVARFKTLLDNLRNNASTDGVLAISAGDAFLAGPEFEIGQQDGVNYDAIAFAAIDYDAAAIGNHEFDFGPEIFEAFVTDAKAAGSTAAFVSTNLDYSNEPGLLALENSGDLTDVAIFDFNGTQIGVIGATTPNLPFIASPRDVIVGQNIAAAVQADIDTLKNNGIEIIILASHLQGIDEEAAVVAATNGLDIVIAGGGDNLLANPGNTLIPGDSSEGAYPRVEQDMSGRNVQLVSTQDGFKYIGRLVANFDAAGEVVSIDASSGPVRVAGGAEPDAVTADPFLQSNVVDPVLTGVNALAQDVIASSEVPLNGVTDDIRSFETNLGNLIADAFLFSANQRASDFGLGNVDIAFANGGGIRNNNVLPAGDFTTLTSFDVLPFLNFISVFEDVSPERLKLICENAYERVFSIRRAGGGTGRFAQIAGFTVEFNPIGQGAEYTFDGTDYTITNPGDRVESIVLNDGTVIVANGQVVAGAPNVSLAIVDFLARGGDEYPLADLTFTNLGVTYQQSLAEYVQSLGTISAAEYPVAGEGRITNLLVENPADTNRDGAVNAMDFAAWLELFNAGNGGADQDFSRGINGLDFGAWLRNFNEVAE